MGVGVCPPYASKAFGWCCRAPPLAHTHTHTGSVCLFLYNNDSLTSKEDQGLHSESEHKEVKEGGGEGRRPGGNGKRK